MIIGLSWSQQAPPLTDLEADLELLTADLPIVISLPVLLRTYLPSPPERTVHALLGLSEAEYRKGCLGGFGRAEECGIAVGERVLAVLRGEVKGLGAGVEAAQEGEGGSEAEATAKGVLMAWLERELDAARAERDGAEACAMH